MAEEKSYVPVGDQQDLSITGASEEGTFEIETWPYTPQNAAEAALLSEHPLVKEEGAQDPGGDRSGRHGRGKRSCRGCRGGE